MLVLLPSGAVLNVCVCVCVCVRASVRVCVCVCVHTREAGCVYMREIIDYRSHLVLDSILSAEISLARSDQLSVRSSLSLVICTSYHMYACVCACI